MIPELLGLAGTSGDQLVQPPMKGPQQKLFLLSFETNFIAKSANVKGPGRG